MDIDGPHRAGLRWGLGLALGGVLALAVLGALALLGDRPGGAPGGGPGDRTLLLAALAVGLLLGLAASLWISRALTDPLASLAEAAQRIARGDLAVRAEPGQAAGGLAVMLRHFNDMAGALEAFERDRKAMVAAISHELRTPLTVLCARLHAACDGVVAADEAELRRLLDQAEHLGRLVGDLHTLAMAQAGRLTLHRAPLDLAALAQESLQSHAPRLAQHGIEARLEGADAPVPVDGDADRLRQVLSNLIENATRHGSAGGRLLLRLEHGAGRVRLALSDAGGGDPGAVRSHMLRGLGDPAHPRAPAAGGSGLGLAIVRMLVLQHGGEVEVLPALHEGRPVGVTVAVSLPAAEA